jgi:ketosteroid isomerase-like protein
MSDNGQKIIELDKKRMDAMCQKDIATLDTLLSDDLVYTHSSARLDTKQSLINGMESGTTVYTAVEPADVKAQDLGDAVVLTGTDVYANQNGRWQMVAWQSTRLP